MLLASSVSAAEGPEKISAAAPAASTVAVPAQEKWPGVDETVVEKYAREAGRPPTKPWLNLEGDALLFAFLCAGLFGGFVCGYQYYKLFVAGARKTEPAGHV